MDQTHIPRLRAKTGFTLIELLIGVGLFAMLALIVGASIQIFLKRSAELESNSGGFQSAIFAMQTLRRDLKFAYNVEPDSGDQSPCSLKIMQKYMDSNNAPQNATITYQRGLCGTRNQPSDEMLTRTDSRSPLNPTVLKGNLIQAWCVTQPFSSGQNDSWDCTKVEPFKDWAIGSVNSTANKRVMVVFEWPGPGTSPKRTQLFVGDVEGLKMDPPPPQREILPLTN
jgi:prepilin-type N-terminal cleavage/methylation domain-containing protein